MNKTYMALILEFESEDIPLEKAGPKYFSLSGDELQNRARLQKLPVPVYRLGSQKSKWYISATDLAKLIDAKREEARKDWERINAA